MVTILQLAGLNDRNEVLLINTDKSGQKRFLDIDKVSPLLEPLNPQLFRHRKLLYGGVKSNWNVDIKPNIVYNSIGDPDRCSRSLERAQQASKSNPFPFINHPDLIVNVRADRLYELTKDIEGVTSPKCLRVTPYSLNELENALIQNGLSVPFIVKEVGTDPEVQNSFLLEDADEFYKLERFAFDGRAYYVTQFYDYRSKDDLYRKYRFFVMGNKILPGHLIVSREWYIVDDEHAHKTLNASLNTIEKEEKTFLKTYQKKRLPALLAIKEKVGLDFFAIDCSIDEKGEILLFNIDCEAHYFERVKNEGYYNEKQIQRYNEAVESMLLNKLKEGGPKSHV